MKRSILKTLCNCSISIDSIVTPGSSVGANLCMYIFHFANGASSLADSEAKSMELISEISLPIIGKRKKKKRNMAPAIIVSVISAATDLLIFILNFPNFSEVRKFIRGCPISEITAAMSKLVSIELKYHARNSIIAHTAIIMIYFASLFINRKMMIQI